ncbi:hypothetical protein OSB04_032279 [Centaurea solstitialis]|uniref:Reverse transcriptase Ty1/copia-type domain-containing protein n=1 Tax=Centaurea solstitialis TaxID=347529 RepID=A0AA38SNA7_9ASTR|nr:hypothetical protein OSB04_032279 [Centaurea solstitialis]
MGCLRKTVFMEQPPGYVDARYPNHVCRLKKALYGLKQAPRAWFQRFSDFLSSLGFTYSRANTSLFIYCRGSSLIYLLVYVDDIIVTGNDDSLIQRLIDRIHKTFAIKDLEKLNYFLGLEVTYTDDGLFLSQEKYAHDILLRAKLHESKPVTTPMVVGQHLSLSGDRFDEPTLYRSLVGALQYLTITRPDISYAVSTVSQFTHNPAVTHFQAVKRILRYVKGTSNFGLAFTHAPSCDILTYSDDDWGDCPDTWRSTSRYSIFLGPNLVTWSSKKQQTVATSSCESEYRALANATSDVIWVTHLLQELHIRIPRAPTILSDKKCIIHQQ